MASRKPSELNLTLPVIRSSLNWNQAELARAAGLPPNAVSDFERGNRAFSAEKLEELAGMMGLPVEAVTQARAFVRSMRQHARPPGDPDEDAQADRRHVEKVAVQAGNVTTEFARTLLNGLSEEGRALVPPRSMLPPYVPEITPRMHGLCSPRRKSGCRAATTPRI